MAGRPSRRRYRFAMAATWIMRRLRPRLRRSRRRQSQPRNPRRAPRYLTPKSRSLSIASTRRLLCWPERQTSPRRRSWMRPLANAARNALRLKTHWNGMTSRNRMSLSTASSRICGPVCWRSSSMLGLRPQGLQISRQRPKRRRDNLSDRRRVVDGIAARERSPWAAFSLKLVNRISGSVFEVTSLPFCRIPSFVRFSRFASASAA